MHPDSFAGGKNVHSIDRLSFGPMPVEGRSVMGRGVEVGIHQPHDDIVGRWVLRRRRDRRRPSEMAGPAGLLALGLLSACIPTRTEEPRAISQVAPPPAARVAAQPVLDIPPPPSPPASFANAIQTLGRSLDGTVGIAVHDLDAGWTATFNGGAPFPQQSVSKLWVAVTALDAIDRGLLSLDDPVLIQRQDMVVFNQPIASLIGPNGYRTTVRSLIDRAMRHSDNLANDALLRRVGGPDAVRAMLARKGLRGIGFGNGERLLQSEIAGLDWRQDYAGGRAFETARAKLPMDVRKAAMERYLARPMDGASPEGIAAALARLARGQLLSPASTAALIDMMSTSRTGHARMKAGMSPGWILAHKTGTGQELGGLATGFNDVGLLIGPDGRRYAVAVLIASSRRPIRERQELIASVARAVISHDRFAPLQQADRGGGAGAPTAVGAGN